MPAGFQSWNEQGHLQIDGTNRNLQFKSKWTANTTASLVFADTSGNYLQQVLTSSFPSDCPVLAVRCDHPIANMGMVWDKDAGAASYTFLVNSTSPVPVTFYSFELMKDAGTGFGIRAYDPSGQLVFDACQKPFRVDGYINASGDGSHSFPAGKTYAMVVSDMIGSVVKPMVSPWLVNTLFAKNSGSDIVSQLTACRSSASYVGTTADFYSTTGQIVVVNVTNY